MSTRWLRYLALSSWELSIKDVRRQGDCPVRTKGRGSIFRDFVQTSFLDGPLTDKSLNLNQNSSKLGWPKNHLLQTNVSLLSAWWYRYPWLL